MSESNRDKSDTNRDKVALQRKHNQRITVARHGKEAFNNKDYINAARKYTEYLSILAESKNINDIYMLSPKMFDIKKDVTELLLISHIYWELARINELTGKLQSNYAKCINQFVKFTVNQPFQVLNAEMIRKYIKKTKSINKDNQLLNKAYQEIFVQSSKCFIATECFGPEHTITNTLREFKSDLLKVQFGSDLIQAYYRISTILIEFSNSNSFLKKMFLSIFRPLLICFTFIYKKMKAF